MKKETIRILEWVIDLNKDGSCLIFKWEEDNKVYPYHWTTVKTLKEALEYVAERIEQ